jgi:hypothetical protein
MKINIHRYITKYILRATLSNKLTHYHHLAFASCLNATNRSWTAKQSHGDETLWDIGENASQPPTLS